MTCIIRNYSVSYLPSSSLTASDASLGSSNSTKAKPGGFLATQTLLRGPQYPKALSNSVLFPLFPRFPTYTLQSRGQSLLRGGSETKEKKIMKENNKGFLCMTLTHPILTAKFKANRWLMQNKPQDQTCTISQMLHFWHQVFH